LYVFVCDCVCDYVCVTVCVQVGSDAIMSCTE